MDTIVFTRMPLPTVRTSTFSTISTCSYSSLSPISFSFSCSKKLKVVYGSQHLRKKQQTSSLVTRRRIRCGIVEEINEGQFSDVVLKSDRPVLVEFVATWCGPCRLIAPAIESLAQEYKEELTVVKVDHDSNPRLIEEYKVYGLPAMILFKDGKEVPDSRREGAITKVKLKEYVDALLQSVSVA